MAGMDDIKSTLYQLLQKTKGIEPKYKFGYVDTTGGPQLQLFTCELRIHGFKYVGESGLSKSKKAAQTAAATKFCEWLVEHGHYGPEQFPQLFPQQAGEAAPQEKKSPTPPIEDIKMSLHSVLGKAKWVLPDYKYTAKNDGRQYFECVCKVVSNDGQEYEVKCERAQQKKEAQTICAMEMAEVLVNAGHFPLKDFPQLAEEIRRREEIEENGLGCEEKLKLFD